MLDCEKVGEMFGEMMEMMYICRKIQWVIDTGFLICMNDNL